MHYNKEENMQFYEYMRFYTSVTIHKGRHAHDEQKKESLPRVNEIEMSFCFLVCFVFQLHFFVCWFFVFWNLNIFIFPLPLGMHTSNCSCYIFFLKNYSIFSRLHEDNCMLVDTFSMHNFGISSGRSPFSNRNKYFYVL